MCSSGLHGINPYVAGIWVEVHLPSAPVVGSHWAADLLLTGLPVTSDWLGALGQDQAERGAASRVSPDPAPLFPLRARGIALTAQETTLPSRAPSSLPAAPEPSLEV
jgi:hypothetical protein